MPFDDELRQAAAPLWEAQHAHPFVQGLGDGTLAIERFRHYVRQDYLYLIDYGRLLALGAARAPDLPTMAKLAELTQAILVTEMELHRSFAAEWDIAPTELEATAPTATTRAYVDSLLRTAALGDFSELIAVLLPCMWSYAEIGQRLASQQPANDGSGQHPSAQQPTGGSSHTTPANSPNPYAAWIETYASAEFVELAHWCRQLTRELGDSAGPASRAAMQRAFLEASRHELAFWEASWQQEPPAA